MTALPGFDPGTSRLLTGFSHREAASPILHVLGRRTLGDALPAGYSLSVVVERREVYLAQMRSGERLRPRSR